MAESLNTCVGDSHNETANVTKETVSEFTIEINGTNSGEVTNCFIFCPLLLGRNRRKRSRFRSKKTEEFKHEEYAINFSQAVLSIVDGKVSMK